MSGIAFLGAIEIGLVYGLVALGVFITFRILNFPDLTVDGSFPLGGAVAATLIVAGYDPFLATLLACLAGGVAGLVTAFLAVRCGILHLLASILTMIALFSINIRVMGMPNIALLGVDTILTPFAFLGLKDLYLRPLAAGVILALCSYLLIRYLLSQNGLALRAAGMNPRMARANGVPVDLLIYFGLALSNGLVALGGAMFSQTNGFADVTTGVGTIVVGLAAVILGETILRSRRIWVMALACVLGSILYRIAIALALNSDWIGMEASDLNLVTALLVALALIAPKLAAKGRSSRLKHRLRREQAGEDA